MIGAPQIKILCKGAGSFGADEIRTFRDRVFALARPSFTFEYTMTRKEPLIGSSYLWGSPDLPEGSFWPVLGECQHWHGDCGLPDDLPCNFGGQINLAELSGTVAAAALPRAGLLSFFTHCETERHGVTSARVIFTSDTSRLRDRTRPNAWWTTRTTPLSQCMI
jgi:uncharacterized protein YwqG